MFTELHLVHKDTVKDALNLLPFGSYTFPLESPHVLIYSKRSEKIINNESKMTFSLSTKKEFT